MLYPCRAEGLPTLPSLDELCLARGVCAWRLPGIGILSKGENVRDPAHVSEGEEQRQQSHTQCVWTSRRPVWTVNLSGSSDDDRTHPHQICIRKGTCDGSDDSLDSESLSFPRLQHDRYRGIGYCCSGGATSSLHADELAKSPTPYFWDASLRSLLLPHSQHFGTNGV
jgi:hypothetical protein